jgi:hypothetical protein
VFQIKKKDPHRRWEEGTIAEQKDFPALLSVLLLMENSRNVGRKTKQMGFRLWKSIILHAVLNDI